MNSGQGVARSMAVSRWCSTAARTSVLLGAGTVPPRDESISLYKEGHL